MITDEMVERAKLALCGQSSTQYVRRAGGGVDVERPGKPETEIPEYLREGFLGGAFPAGSVPLGSGDGQPTIDWPKSDPRFR